MSLSNGQKVLILAASPIGNLGDVSPRLREALTRAQVVFAEDTRRARTLYAALGIEPQAVFVRWDVHREFAASEPALPVEWTEGASVALYLSDAGAPGVSDPGLGLVDRAHRAGVRVDVIPGPSAVTAAVGLAGFGVGAGFSFVGFPPRKRGDRQRFVETWAKLGRLNPELGPIVGFESPERIEGWLEELAETQKSLQIAAIKEISKIHQAVWRGTAAEVLTQIRAEKLKDAQIWRGEWVWVWERAPEARAETLNSPSESSNWVDVLKSKLDAGGELKRIAEEVSHEFGISKREVYQRGISEKKPKK